MSVVLSCLKTSISWFSNKVVLWPDKQTLFFQHQYLHVAAWAACSISNVVFRQTCNPLIPFFLHAALKKKDRPLHLFLSLKKSWEGQFWVRNRRVTFKMPLQILPFCSSLQIVLNFFFYERKRCRGLSRFFQSCIITRWLRSSYSTLCMWIISFFGFIR